MSLHCSLLTRRLLLALIASAYSLACAAAKEGASTEDKSPKAEVSVQSAHDSPEHPSRAALSDADLLRFDRLVYERTSLVCDARAVAIPLLGVAVPDLDPMRSLYLVSEAEANKRAAVRLDLRALDRVESWEREDFGFLADADLFAVLRQGGGSEQPLADSAILGGLVRSQVRPRAAAYFAVDVSSCFAPASLAGFGSGAHFAFPVAKVSPLSPLGSAPLARNASPSAGVLRAAGASSQLASAGSITAHFASAPTLSLGASISQAVLGNGGSPGGAPSFTGPPRLTDWESINWTKTKQVAWGPTVNVVASGNYLITTDRQLGSIKLDGVASGVTNPEGVTLGG